MWNSDENVNLLIEWPSAGLGLDNDTVWIWCQFLKGRSIAKAIIYWRKHGNLTSSQCVLNTIMCTFFFSSVDNCSFVRSPIILFWIALGFKARVDPGLVCFIASVDAINY